MYGTKADDSHWSRFAAELPAWLIPLSALAAITGADLALRGRSGVSGMFAVVPALAILHDVDQRRFHVIGAVTFSVCVTLAVYHWRGDLLAATAGVVGVMVVCGAGCLNHLRRLAATEAVAEAVQCALMRPLPSRLGPLRLEARYLASAPQAKVGGDLYDAAWTTHGVRLMIGDVMGKGLGAVESAGRLLGAFREAAYDEPDLTSLAWRLHTGLARAGRTGVFATALLVGVSPDGEVAEVLSCGHPPPLLLREAGGVEEVEIRSPLPPLGMLDFGQEHTSAGVALAPGDGLLLYTDGFTEARDARGRFFPLIEHAEHAEPANLVQHLVDGLAAHAGARRGDDAALVLLRRRPVAVEADHRVRPGATP
jgi:stage II sporulation SpoE-like protein